MRTWHYTMDLTDAYLKYRNGGSANNRAYLIEAIKEINSFIMTATVTTTTSEFEEMILALIEVRDACASLLDSSDIPDYMTEKELDLLYVVGDIFGVQIIK